MKKKNLYINFSKTIKNKKYYKNQNILIKFSFCMNKLKI